MVNTIHYFVIDSDDCQDLTAGIRYFEAVDVKKIKENDSDYNVRLSLSS